MEKFRSKLEWNGLRSFSFYLCSWRFGETGNFVWMRVILLVAIQFKNKRISCFFDVIFAIQPNAYGWVAVTQLNEHFIIISLFSKYIIF